MTKPRSSHIAISFAEYTMIFGGTAEIWNREDSAKNTTIFMPNHDLSSKGVFFVNKNFCL